MSKTNLSDYDARFAAWWTEVLAVSAKYGRDEIHPEPSHGFNRMFDVNGAFDDSVSPAQFVYECSGDDSNTQILEG